MRALADHGLVEIASKEDQAELSARMGTPVLWAARVAPAGYDLLLYDRARPRPENTGQEPVAGRQLVRLRPSQMAALRLFLSLAGELHTPSVEGLAEQVRTARCDHGTRRWLLYLTPEQMHSVAYGFWLHRMTGSATEANHFARDYGIVHRPARLPRTPSCSAQPSTPFEQRLAWYRPRTGPAFADAAASWNLPHRLYVPGKATRTGRAPGTKRRATIRRYPTITARGEAFRSSLHPSHPVADLDEPNRRPRNPRRR